MQACTLIACAKSYLEILGARSDGYPEMWSLTHRDSAGSLQSQLGCQLD